MYPNTLRAVMMNGSQVREWLEMSAGIFNRIDPDVSTEQELLNPDFSNYNFDVIDGVNYHIDVTQPPRYDRDGNRLDTDSHRIVDLRFNGQPIDDDQVFVVATNNYRAGGGGHFPGLDGSNIIIEAPDTNRDVLADYIFDLKTIDPSADGNWSLVPISSDVFVTFSSSPRARESLALDSPIESIGINDDGSGKYRIRF